MAISILDMFSIGIGPSSSHTVGPMRAGLRFLESLRSAFEITLIDSVKVELFGSLGYTGKGHCSDKAVILGLLGEQPEEVKPDTVADKLQAIELSGQLLLDKTHIINFTAASHIIFHRRKSLPKHPNGMQFSAYDSDGDLLFSKIYYSVGGGFIVNDDVDDESPVISDTRCLPYPFSTGDELLNLCKSNGLSISALMLANESAWRLKSETKQHLLNIWQTMKDCIHHGCHTEGILPGGLKVKRRAAHLYRRLKADDQSNSDPLKVMDWVNLYALAVNEENAAGGKVVTAPTNGAAGIIPAVLFYFHQFKENCDDDAVIRFLLTAGAIGILFKENASISGAEVGCQGEIGVACSMAAAGLAEVLGATVEQCEDAAEIGMEHNLGLTCDPVGGLVQIPCIERNAMAAVTAINAARLALHGDGSHKVTLDKVICTMRDTGADMKVKYKETARGGLAVNIIEC
ncbi:MAG: L-serine ammonia-lyase [Gammaproteobacteria bacterium]|nr:L-serine ammonia-lyase [Gammaproteobacteria bacterium]